MVPYKKDGKDYILVANTAFGLLKVQADHLETYATIDSPTKNPGHRRNAVREDHERDEREAVVAARWIERRGADSHVRPGTGIRTGSAGRTDEPEDDCPAVVNQAVRNAGAVVAAMLLAGVAAMAQSPVIELQGGAFRVSGWKAPQSEPSGGWGTVFLVYAGTGKVPALLGSYAVEAGTLVFHPRFPVMAGVHYHAVFREPSGLMIARDFDGPSRATNPVARVEQIYPSADVLPSNLLRLYVVFSDPMSRGEAAGHIHMEDDRGNILPDELLPGQELWDPTFRRLTMTFDPGRIKRGLTSNRTIGPPIVEGRHYRLVIDRDWPDARGVRWSRALPGTWRSRPRGLLPIPRDGA